MLTENLEVLTENVEVLTENVEVLTENVEVLTENVEELTENVEVLTQVLLGAILPAARRGAIVPGTLLRLLHNAHVRPHTLSQLCPK